MASTAMTHPELNILLDDVVTTAAGLETTINQLMAVKTALLATASRIADDEPFDSLDDRELTRRAVAAELAAVLRVSDRTLEAQMGDAAMLVGSFPATAEAFGSGGISHAHVRVILAAGASIETQSGRDAFEALVLIRAERESPNRLRPYALQTAERFRDVSFTERHRQARERRGVWTRQREDGMAELVQFGPAALIQAERDRLTQMARVEKEARAELAQRQPHGSVSADEPQDDFADQRMMAQLRCDLLTDLVLTGSPAGHSTGDGVLGEIRAHIDITVPVLTLTDTDDSAQPGHLEGIGPIDPETARLLVSQAPGFDRVLTDPVAGTVLGVDRYRPSAQMRRYLRARDRRCRFPGCRMLARLCDGDHTRDHALGGPTRIDNLADLCRRHHMTKHATPWRVRQLGGGLLEWTSPTGRSYVDRPPGVATVITAADVYERLPGPAPF